MDIYTAIVFAIAMGYLEAAVVVYLRELYYPEGFYIKEKVKFLDPGLEYLRRDKMAEFMYDHKD